jgi:hypothetical protein
MPFVRLLETCIVMGMRLRCESAGPFLCLAAFQSMFQSLYPLNIQPASRKFASTCSCRIKLCLDAAYNVSAAPATTAFQRSNLSCSIYLTTPTLTFQLAVTHPSHVFDPVSLFYHHHHHHHFFTDFRHSGLGTTLFHIYLSMTAIALT